MFSKEDFSGLKHKSVVAYFGARAPEAVAIQAAIDDGLFKLLDPLPFPVIKRIVDEAREHDDMAPKWRKFLPSKDHPDCQG